MNLFNVRNVQELKAAFKRLNSGDVVLIYPGDYRLTPTNTPESPYGAELVLQNVFGVRIVGLGRPSLTRVTHGSAILIHDCDNVRIENVAFIGPGILRGVENEISYALVQFYSLNRRIVIEHCMFLDGGNHGIAHLWGPRTTCDCLFQHNHFENGGNYSRKTLLYDGAACAVGGGNNRFLHNRVVNWLRGAEIENPFPPTQSSNCVIAHNTFERCPWQTILVTPDCAPSQIPQAIGTFDNIHIKDNTIIGTKTKTEKVSNTGIYLTGGRFAQITGNVIRDIADGIGILFQAEHGDIEDCLIESNTIAGVDRNGIHLMRGSSGTVKRCVVRGNMLRSIAGAPLYAESSDMVASE